MLLPAGDLIWILTQSQLRAVSRLVQSLMDAAVRTQQLKRMEEEDEGSDGESIDSQDSISSERSSGKTSANKSASDSKKKKTKPKKGRSSRSSLLKDRLMTEKVAQYMDGKKNLPAYEVIQNSFHLKTGKVDLQLCDDTSRDTENVDKSGGKASADHVQGSLLIQVRMTSAI